MRMPVSEIEIRMGVAAFAPPGSAADPDGSPLPVPCRNVQVSAPPCK